MAVFTLSETKEAIKKLYPLRIPILLNGATGVGKTAIVKEVSEELGLPLIDIWLAQETPQSISKIPQSNYFSPVFESGAVLFFEHLNRSTPSVRQAVMSVFSERTLGGKKLHPDTLVIGAVNTGADYTNTDDLEEDLLARFAIINVVPSTDEILSYFSEEDPEFSSMMVPILKIFGNEIRGENRFEQLTPTYKPRNILFARKVFRKYRNDPFLKKLLYTVLPQNVVDIVFADLDFSLIRSILAGQDVEVEEEKVPDILAVISSMPLKDDNEFLNALRFAKKIYKEFGMEDSIVGFLSNLARRNRDFVIRHMTYINNEFPNLKDELSL